MDQLPSEVVSSLFLEASKQRMGDHWEFQWHAVFLPSLTRLHRKELVWGGPDLCFAKQERGRYSLQVRSVPQRC